MMLILGLLLGAGGFQFQHCVQHTRKSLVVVRADAAEPMGSEDEKKKNLVRRLWDGARRRIATTEDPVVEPAVVSDENEERSLVPDLENSKLYAELAKRREEVENQVDDKAIYDTIAAKTDFPRIAKKLNEALQNRSLFQDATAVVAPNATTLADFTPSPGQSPGEVIDGVLRALRDDGEGDDGTIEYRGCETLLKFASSASSLGGDGDDKNPAAIARFLSHSEYNILFDWDNIVFSSPLRLSIDGERAYQTTKLRDKKTGEWHKVKWALSLRDTDETKDGLWLIDTIMVARRP